MCSRSQQVAVADPIHFIVPTCAQMLATILPKVFSTETLWFQERRYILFENEEILAYVILCFFEFIFYWHGWTSFGPSAYYVTR